MQDRILVLDLDGTLVDSNHIWTGIDQAFLARRNAPYTAEYIAGVAHTIPWNCAVFAKEYLKLDETPEEILAEWMELAQDAYDRVEAKPHVKEKLAAWKAAGARMAVFTSSVPEHCSAALAANGIAGYFEQTVFAHDIGIDKRSPDAFRALTRILGTEPGSCVLFDDALENCASAKKAGLTVIGVYDSREADDEAAMRVLCDGYAKDFSELPDDPATLP